jgi:hypothetical protein
VYDAGVLAQESEARNHNEVVVRLKHLVDGVVEDWEAVTGKRQNQKMTEGKKAPQE